MRHLIKDRTLTLCIDVPSICNITGAFKVLKTIAIAITTKKKNKNASIKISLKVYLNIRKVVFLLTFNDNRERVCVLKPKVKTRKMLTNNLSVSEDNSCTTRGLCH